jgi:hypothetical protein
MDDHQTTPVRIEALLRFSEAEPGITAYANQMTVQLADHEFILTFYQAFPPLTLGMTQEDAKAIKEIVAKPVARVIVPATKASDFVDALGRAMQVYKAISTPTEKSEDA